MTKRVVVTGASSGIGEATARRFAANGWEVVGVARRAERLAGLQAEIGLVPIVVDLSDDAALARAAAEISALGPLDALVNNAGGAFGLDTVEHGDVADWRAMFEINVIAVKQLIGALLPALRRGAAEHGNADILTITSIAAQVAYEGGGGYNAAKFAAHALMGALRLELVGEPIRVIEVAPGMVKTDFSLVRFGGDQERADAVYQGVENPLTADDIAETIVHAIELPGHVNLDLVTIKPVAQGAPYKLARGPLAPKD
ncbi:SDR family NAD(P)-dependent oxidoreductase [Schumannella soli]|uniref:SDR family NAD(P)-dependent oxidoreductase n=1 Tax=Schumannella soli TaxID=2590779 RepID=UPI0015E84ADD|nr:SDR family NAD(P)-dependent oxidoreductase [Schumannella soli]